MRNLFAWKIASLLAVSIWLWVTFTAIQPAPDWREGELFVAVPPDGMDVEAAFELELATLFAQHMHLKLKPLAMDYDQIENALLAHEVHLAAVGMRRDERATLRYTPSYQTLREKIVCHERSPRNLAELEGLSLSVVAGSAQEDALREAARELDNLHWEQEDVLAVPDLLEAVANGELDCTVANEEQIALARNFYPQLGNALDLGQPSQLAWAFATDGDPALFNAAREFFDTLKKDGSLSRLIDRHYGHNERLLGVNAAAFIASANTVLPQYQHWFEEAAALTGIDWQLLAALAYQESHWDPLATSFTNVRGMMMLTEDTAQRMGLTDRLDPHAGILAGAKYLKLLSDSLPRRINDKERIWMALAAYNQGLGHLEDARILTMKAGLNPDVWSDVRKMMPLLARPAYYESTKYGQARGGEAVILVETVRLYHDMLKHLTLQYTPRLPPTPYFGYPPSRPKTVSLP